MAMPNHKNSYPNGMLTFSSNNIHKTQYTVHVCRIENIFKRNDAFSIQCHNGHVTRTKISALEVINIKIS